MQNESARNEVQAEAEDLVEQLKAAEKNQSNAVLFYQKFIDSLKWTSKYWEGVKESGNKIEVVTEERRQEGKELMDR